ncbi:MAG: rhomboid family intramembrane serine protease [Nanoarchaeota archaeon]|nr:rhomboid family intramembrane serine protease [Nanoarchaeota archaeon]
MELHKFKKINVTYLLISICLTVFFIELFYNYFVGPEALEALFYTFGFSLENIMAGGWWSFITSIFMHASSEHLVLNMIALFFFGSVIEHELGSGKILLIFFAAALLGNVAVILASLLGIMPATIPVIGASAAIFGLLGTAMLVKPLEFVLFPYLIPIPLILVALIYTIFNITEFLVILATGGISDIAYVAHIGGLIFGMLYGFKIEGQKNSFKVLILILIVLIVIPFIWEMLSYLELTNYATFLSTGFK